MRAALEGEEAFAKVPQGGRQLIATPHEFTSPSTGKVGAKRWVGVTSRERSWVRSAEPCSCPLASLRRNSPGAISRREQTGSLWLDTALKVRSGSLAPEYPASESSSRHSPEEAV